MRKLVVRKTKNAGWVPKQHGAWPMLIIPYIAGLVLASQQRSIGVGDLLLGVTWFAGYFAFSAGSLWLKANPKRRAKYQPALFSYLGISAVSGIGTLIFSGLQLLWWVPLFAALLGPTLWLVAHKKERSLASGMLTVIASCMLMLILWLTTPFALAKVTSADSPAFAVIIAVTGYFIGTVFYVKSLIRERNQTKSAVRSALFHIGYLAIILVFVNFRLLVLPWLWMIWAAAILVRTIIFTRWSRTQNISARDIGFTEIGFTIVLLILVIAPLWN